MSFKNFYKGWELKFRTRKILLKSILKIHQDRNFYEPRIEGKDFRTGTVYSKNIVDRTR